MSKATAPPAAPPAEVVKKTEKKQLTEVQKHKLLSVHLNQRITQLEADKVAQMKVIVALQAELQTFKAAQGQAEADAIYKELGITKGDELELRNDGTLTINPPPISSKPPMQELFSKKNKRANGDRREPKSTQPD